MKYKNSSKPKIEIKTAKEIFPDIGTCLKVLTKRTAKIGAMNEIVIRETFYIIS